MSEDVISIRIRLREAAKFAGETRIARIEIDELGDAAARADRKSKGASGSLNLLQRTMKLLKPAALITGLGLATQFLSAASAGAIGLASSLAPLGGLLGALPGALLVAAQGAGVLRLAFNGVGGAVGGLNAEMNPKKFAALQPSAQKFALTLDSLKKPILELQRRVQSGLFPGLTVGLKAASPAIGALMGPLAGTGRVLGGIGKHLGRLVGSGGFLKDLSSQAKFNNVQLGRLGGAGLHVVDALRQLIVTSRPLVSWLVRMVSGWAKSADSMAKTGRSSGSLTRMFHAVQVAVSRVVRIGGNLAVTLWNIGRIGKRELGDSLLVSLVRGSKALREWSGSASGIKSITGYFQQAKPVVYAVGRLFAAMVKDFLGFGAGGKGLAGMFDMIRTRLLPVIVEVIKGTTSAFGPTLINAIVEVARAFAPLAGSSGPLVLFARGLTLLARAAAWIERNVPGASTALTGLVGAYAALQALGWASFTGKMFGASRGVAAITGAMRALVVWTGLATAAGAAEMGIMEATTAAATGMWLAITGPVGLVVLAVAAVAGVFVALYLKVGWFHRAVDNVWSWIKNHWPLLLSILTGPFGALVIYVATHFGQVLGFVKSLPHRIAHAASGMWDGIKDGLKSAVNWVIGIWNWLTGKLQVPAIHFGPIHYGGSGRLISPIPKLAAGGFIQQGGSVLVGEQGPELLSLPRGAQVTPLSPSISAPVMAEVRRTGGTDGWGGAPIHIHSHMTLKLDSQPIAEGTGEVVARHKALE